MKRMMVIVAGIVCGAALLAGLVGCGGAEQLRAFEARAQAMRNGLDADIAELERALPATTPGTPAHASIEQTLAEARAMRATADAARAQAAAVIDQIDGNLPAGRPMSGQAGTRPLDGLAQAASPWLPEPVRVPLLLSAALVGSLVRWGQWRNGLLSVVESIEQAKKDDPVFAERVKANATTLRSSQSPIARKSIRRVRRERGQTGIPA